MVVQLFEKMFDAFIEALDRKEASLPMAYSVHKRRALEELKETLLSKLRVELLWNKDLLKFTVGIAAGLLKDIHLILEEGKDEGFYSLKYFLILCRKINSDFLLRGDEIFRPFLDERGDISSDFLEVEINILKLVLP